MYLIICSDEAHQWLDVRVAESVDAVLAELDVIYDQYMMNPPVLHEVLTLDDVVTIQDVLKLLRSFEQSSDRHSEVIDYIRNRLDPDQPMPACACCGEIYASAMDRPVSGEQVSGCERHVAELSILRLRPDEVNAYFAVEEQHRPCLSVYRAVVENEVVYYHLHPQFVNGDGVATLCMRCCHDIETHHRKPEFSLANGFDYGDIERLPGRASIHRPLTIAEQMAISKARPYCVMIKQYLERGAAHRFKLASHMITMPFGGPDVIDDLSLIHI